MGLELLCAVREGFLEEAMPWWGLKEASTQGHRTDHRVQREGTRRKTELQVGSPLPSWDTREGLMHGSVAVRVEALRDPVQDRRLAGSR